MFMYIFCYSSSSSSSVGDVESIGDGSYLVAIAV